MSQPSKNAISVPSFTRGLAQYHVVLCITFLVTSIVGVLLVAEARELFDESINVVLLHEEQVTIALLLMGFGAYVQAIEFIISHHSSDRNNSKFDLGCSFLGLSILVIGILIEIVDHVLWMLSENRTVIIWIEYGINYPLSLLCGIFLVLFFIRFARLGHRME